MESDWSAEAPKLNLESETSGKTTVGEGRKEEKAEAEKKQILHCREWYKGGASIRNYIKGLTSTAQTRRSPATNSHSARTAGSAPQHTARGQKPKSTARGSVGELVRNTAMGIT